MTTVKTIDLWLDRTSEEVPHWIVDRGDVTQASFAADDYADALIFAKDECQRTGYPVVKIDSHGNRETIYSISRSITDNSDDQHLRDMILGRVE